MLHEPISTGMFWTLTIGMQFSWWFGMAVGYWAGRQSRKSPPPAG